MSVTMYCVCVGNICKPSDEYEVKYSITFKLMKKYPSGWDVLWDVLSYQSWLIRKMLLETS